MDQVQRDLAHKQSLANHSNRAASRPATSFRKQESSGRDRQSLAIRRRAHDPIGLDRSRSEQSWHWERSALDPGHAIIEARRTPEADQLCSAMLAARVPCIPTIPGSTATPVYCAQPMHWRKVGIFKPSKAVVVRTAPKFSVAQINATGLWPFCNREISARPKYARPEHRTGALFGGISPARRTPSLL